MPDFDRVIRQVFGDPNDTIDYVYEPETADASNGYAITKAIINDRNGHVEERLYDKFNRGVEVRELTGQADPDLPTSSVANRPAGRLRAADPNAFITRFTYNRDALPVRVIDPEQSVRTYVYQGDLEPLAPPRERGNLRMRVRDPGPRGGNQTELVEEFEYDPNVNADTNQVTREVDPRGHQTLSEYDAAGNRTRVTFRIPSIVEDREFNSFGQLTAHVHPDNGNGHRRRDEFVYYNAGPQTGYLRDSIIDAPGLALTTTYEYNAVGSVVRTIDPRGNDTLRIVNALDQVVRLLSRPVDPNALVRYETDTYYDENDNVIRVDVQNVDETHTPYLNAAITTLYDYGILDERIRETREVDAGRNIVVEYEYDAERNRTLVRRGEATNGHQPNNIVATIYDERDLVFQEVLAAGDQQQSTTQTDYDRNGNVVQTTQGLEGTPRVTTRGYDGYDRHMPKTDPMGNRDTCQYDANGNRVFHRTSGELVDVVGNAANVPLNETTYSYDAMDRRTVSDAGFFDASAQNPIGDGLSSTITTYSDASQVLSVTDDNGRVTTIQYDTANRRSTVTDPKGNTTTYAYDENSNVVSIAETDKSDLGLADEIFVTTFVYDRLDRVVATTDSSGNTTTYGYDSRDNRVLTVDARSTEMRNAYDGLDRLLSRTIDLDGDGADGDGTDIVMTQAWDDSSRLIQQTDDQGNTQGISYDALDRPTVQSYADGTDALLTYDPHHNIITRVDANGSSFSNTYDLLNRRTNTSIAVGPGVSTDTTFETYAYDGLSRLVSSQDDDTSNAFAWTSLSDLTQESLNGKTTTSTYDGVGNRLSIVYPGGLTLDYTYDALDRPSSIQDGPATITSYQYVGPGRVTLQQYGNGARTSFTYDGIQGVQNPPLDFGSKCIVGITHSAGASIIDSRSFTWDRTHNKSERRDTRLGGLQLRHAYTYDAAYRLVSGLQEDRFGIPTRLSNYQLDGVGNRNAISGFGGITGPYALDLNAPPSDLQVNQYTQTPRDTRQYDENGNLLAVVTPVSTATLEYDAYNRLVSRVDSLTGDTADYAYDALGRRSVRTITPGGGSAVETRYFYDGRFVIEDQDPNMNTLATYVRGVRGADIVCTERAGEIVYHHSDDVGNVMALTDPNGNVVERYEYDDFGAPSIFDAAGTPRAASAVDNLYMFGGRLYDPETGWYAHGDRYLDPQNGRYVTRRESGMWDERGNHGNAYTYAGGNPWSFGRGNAVSTAPIRIDSRHIAGPRVGASYSMYSFQKGFRGLAGGGTLGDLPMQQNMEFLRGCNPLRGGFAHDDFVRFAVPPGGGGGGHAAAGRRDHHGHRTLNNTVGGASHDVSYMSSICPDEGLSPSLASQTGGRFKVGQSFSEKVKLAGGGGGGHAMTHGKSKFKAGTSLSKKVNIAGGGPPHDMGGHMNVLKTHGDGTGKLVHTFKLSGGHNNPNDPGNTTQYGTVGTGAPAAPNGAICPPCGMRKVVCGNGLKRGETNILPACNNISSR